ncbi:hypothetical protein BD626DRAFT_483078 [Schizophyllum amplum]|uniref:MYND-type domain-containing protein n=1 Tax=Schizophyllum amplum TaxID=97359 RepID=A0A550CP25_9AGAR|nr:hypothetical protein BD626DRAFT_483078 [Auriculariopsis ampla]
MHSSRLDGRIPGSAIRKLPLAMERLQPDPYTLINLHEEPVRKEVCEQCEFAYQYLCIYLCLMEEASGSPAPDILRRTFAQSWRGAWRWACFFYENANNDMLCATIVQESTHGLLKTLHAFYVATTCFAEGVIAIRDTPGALAQLVDLWVHVSYYEPPTARGCEDFMTADLFVSECIRRVLNTIPVPTPNSSGAGTRGNGNPLAAHATNELLDLVDGQPRKLYHGILHTRLSVYLEQGAALPTEVFDEVLRATADVLSALAPLCPGNYSRDAVYAVMSCWKAVGMRPRNASTVAADGCIRILRTGHSVSTDPRPLLWAIRADLVPLLFSLLRQNARAQHDNWQLLLLDIQFQMRNRRVLRVLRRCAEKYLQEESRGDVYPMKEFTEDYYACLRTEDKTNAWVRKKMNCEPCKRSIRDHSLKRCVCKAFYYCSKECQREHWRENHHEWCYSIANYVQLNSGADIVNAMSTAASYIDEFREGVIHDIKRAQQDEHLHQNSHRLLCTVDLSTIKYDTTSTTEPQISVSIIERTVLDFVMPQYIEVHVKFPSGGRGSLVTPAGMFSLEQILRTDKVEIEMPFDFQWYCDP